MNDELADFRQIMADLRNGAEEAAWKLTQLYGPSVERAIRRRKTQTMQAKLNTSDFLQMVWHSFFRHPDRLQQIESPDELLRFLVTVARNKVADEARRQFQTEKYDVRREQSLSSEETQQQLTTDHDQPDHLAMTRECWQQMLAGQSERNQRIARLRLEGRSYLEIADSVGVHERTARKVVERLLAEHTATIRRSS